MERKKAQKVFKTTKTNTKPRFFRNVYVKIRNLIHVELFHLRACVASGTGGDAPPESTAEHRPKAFIHTKARVRFIAFAEFLAVSRDLRTVNVALT